MFTVCPKCALTLAVTAADLRVGQGYVRCGRCSSVFNALANLHDDSPDTAAAAAPSAPAPAPASSPQTEAPAEPTPPPPAEASRDESPTDQNPALDLVELDLAELDLAAADMASLGGTPPPAATTEPDPAVERGISPELDQLSDAALEFDPTRSDVNTLFVAPEVGTAQQIGSGTFEMIVLEGGELSLPDEVQTPSLAAPASDTAPQPASEDRDDAVDDDLLALAARLEAEDVARRATAAAARHGAPAAPPPQRRASDQAAASPQSSESTPLEAIGPDPSTSANEFIEQLQPGEASAAPERRLRFATIAGCTALAVLLVMQVVHHFRNELASSAALYRPMTSLYGAFGIRLTPHWDLQAYDVRQLGASGEAGRIVVAASVKNGAQRSQPLPVLRLTLQDRYGNRVATRDLEPKEYLRDASAAAAMLDAGGRVDASISLVDPGRNAVGFELDACLRGEADRLACANDGARR